jgi:hypothetical protein
MYLEAINTSGGRWALKGYGHSKLALHLKNIGLLIAALDL